MAPGIATTALEASLAWKLWCACTSAGTVVKHATGPIVTKTNNNNPKTKFLPDRKLVKLRNLPQGTKFRAHSLLLNEAEIHKNKKESQRPPPPTKKKKHDVTTSFPGTSSRNSPQLTFDSTGKSNKKKPPATKKSSRTSKRKTQIDRSSEKEKWRETRFKMVIRNWAEKKTKHTHTHTHTQSDRHRETDG